jgi:hypothetical protein
MYLHFYRLEKKSSKQAFYLSILILIILFCLRVKSDTLNILNSENIGDSYGYLLASDWIKSGKYFHPSTNPSIALELTRRPPIYPYFLYLLGGKNQIYLILTIQTLLGILYFYLLIFYYERLHGRLPYLLLICAILTPSLLIFIHLIMSEILVMVLVMFMVLCLQNITKPKNYITLQIILALLPLIRPIFFPFTIINIILSIFSFRKLKKTIRLVSLIPFIVTILFMGYNQYRTGYFHFTSIENINLLQYNLKAFKSKQIGVENAELWVDSILNKSKQYQTYEQQSRYISKIAKKEIANHWVQYTYYHFCSCFKAVFDPCRYDLFLYFKSGVPSHEGIIQAYNEKGLIYAIKISINWLIEDSINSKSTLFFLANIIVFIALLFQILKWFFIYIYVKNFYKEWTIKNPSILFNGCFILYNFFITGPVASQRYLIPIDCYIFVATSLGFEIWRQNNNSMSSPKISMQD